MNLIFVTVVGPDAHGCQAWADAIATTLADYSRSEAWGFYRRKELALMQRYARFARELVALSPEQHAPLRGPIAETTKNLLLARFGRDISQGYRALPAEDLTPDRPPLLPLERVATQAGWAFLLAVLGVLLTGELKERRAARKRANPPEAVGQCPSGSTRAGETG